MIESAKTILVVDDEESNREILQEILEQAGYTNIMLACDGKVALEILEQHSENICLILLDRMMPHVGGIEVLQKLKANPNWADIPAIMQTAAAGAKQMSEGISAGAYYYITKPYHPDNILSLIRAAIQDHTKIVELRKQTKYYANLLNLFTEIRLEFKTLEEARGIAAILANCYPDPNSMVFGISELLINAVEHGNLGIGYNEKSHLMQEGLWEQEIDKRLALPENHPKVVHVHIVRGTEAITLKIRDAGKGFNWLPYLEIDSERATHTHGRGIALSRLACFDSLNYLGTGNEVICTINLTPADPSMQDAASA